MPGLKLSYHSLKDFSECPKRYHLKNVLRHKPLEPENKVNAFFGTIAANVFENWVKSGVYKLEDQWIPWLVEEVDRQAEDIVSKEFIIWNREDEYNEVRQLAVDTIPRCFNTLKEQGFLDGQVFAEVKAKIPYGDNFLSGRIDFLFQREGRITIIDGKTSKHRDKYLDADQLYMYVLFAREKVGNNYPIDIGYQYVRFGDIDIYDVDEAILKKLQDKISYAFTAIEAGSFAATPSKESCKYCMFRNECVERVAFENNKRSAKSKISVNDLGFGLIDWAF